MPHGKRFRGACAKRTSCELWQPCRRRRKTHRAGERIFEGRKGLSHVGQPLKRLDTNAKVDGTAQFGLDMRLPGMLYAAVARCPVFGGRVASFDATKAKSMPGVKDVVQIATGVAVIANNSWTAMQGCRALNVQWNEGAGASLSTAGISDMFITRTKEQGAEARNDGDISAGLARAAKTIEASYEVPFLAHATMEPMNCTAHVHADSCEVWAPTQMHDRRAQHDRRRSQSAAARKSISM